MNGLLLICFRDLQKKRSGLTLFNKPAIGFNSTVFYSYTREYSSDSNVLFA